MRRTFSIALALAAALTVVALATLPGPAARADQVSHSHHIALHPVGHEPLWSGFVDNIHAHEIYVLNGAQPATTYQVTLSIFAANPACQGSPDLVLPTATITTNPAGNGKGDAVFRPSDVPANLRHATHGVIWTVSDSSGTEYSTRCQ